MLLRMNTKIRKSIVALALVAGSLALATPAAHADQGSLPSGCSLSAGGPSVSNGRITYSGQGYCSGNGITTLKVELWHWWSWLPAVTVASAQDNFGPDWYAGGSTCDNGGTADYFTKAAFWRDASRGGDIIRESSPRSLSHC